MSNFNMIIRSTNKIGDVSFPSSNCTIKINCSTHSRYLRITVKDVFISHKVNETFTSSIADIKAGFEFCNSYDTNNGAVKSIAFTDLRSSNICHSNMSFIITNPANKDIDFSLFNEVNTQLQSTVGTVTGNYDSQWVVTLDCEPLNEI